MTTTPSGGAQDVRRKRLLFRAHRRGFREVDMIFGTYAEQALAGLDEAGLDRFEALLGVPDQEIYLWLQGKAPVPAEHDNAIFAAMKALCNRKNPTWND
ncbi:MAG: succinate dehydrogenase assembly factor 2 [Alphaproteobacteria bacterium]|nr:succinate dehydrogenase assembly factor 2 [Alphaproteobacteria bacterium]